MPVRTAIAISMTVSAMMSTECVSARIACSDALRVADAVSSAAPPRRRRSCGSSTCAVDDASMPEILRPSGPSYQAAKADTSAGCSAPDTASTAVARIASAL